MSYTATHITDGTAYSGCPEVSPISSSNDAEAVEKARAEFGNDLLRVSDSGKVIYNRVPHRTYGKVEIQRIYDANNTDGIKEVGQPIITDTLSFLGAALVGVLFIAAALFLTWCLL